MIWDRVKKESSHTRERERESERERDLTMKDEGIQNKNPEFQLILGQSTIVTSFD